MEVRVESMEDRRRYIIPTVVVATLALTIALAMFLTTKNRKASAGDDGVKVASASAAGAAATANGEEKPNGKEKAPVPVSVHPAVAASIASYLSATANLVAENEVKIVSEAEGRVVQLLVEEGDRVRRGAVLARVLKDDEEIAVQTAQVRVANARATYQRTSEMAQKQLISRSDYDKAKMEKEVAEQQLAEARWRLDRTIIRAPFDGVVTSRMITAGQYVRPAEELFTITDYDPLIARIYLPEKDVIGLTEGREVRISMSAADSVVFKGRVRQVSPVVDTATGTVKLTIEAVQPPEVVRPGSFVTIDIVKEVRPNAILVPREAVVRELRDTHVFVANGGTAQKRTVELGLQEGDNVEAISGVRPGERIIVAGQGGLKDGSPIKVMDGSSKG